MMNPILEIQADRVYHRIVIPEIQRWVIDYGASATYTRVYFRDGTNIEIYGNHDADLKSALSAWHTVTAAYRG